VNLQKKIAEGETLLVLAAVGVGAFFLYEAFQYVKSYFASATDLSKVGAIPGITGASQSQVAAAGVAAAKLQPGGAVIWSSGSDFDYIQPSGQVVTQARHNTLNYFLPWTDPVTYTDVAIQDYEMPSGGNPV
jgi:hypothetical protein